MPVVDLIDTVYSDGIFPILDKGSFLAQLMRAQMGQLQALPKHSHGSAGNLNPDVFPAPLANAKGQMRPTDGTFLVQILDIFVAVLVQFGKLAKRPFFGLPELGQKVVRVAGAKVASAPGQMEGPDSTFVHVLFESKDGLAFGRQRSDEPPLDFNFRLLKDVLDEGSLQKVLAEVGAHSLLHFEFLERNLDFGRGCSLGEST